MCKLTELWVSPRMTITEIREANLDQLNAAEDAAREELSALGCTPEFINNIYG